MQENANRTLICSIVFIDLVGYSKKSVSDQILIKERFNVALAEALQDIAVTERLVLDTGDGAAISFLGDPEDAVFVTLKLRDHYNAIKETNPGDEVRMGINLGPVRLGRGANGQPNIIGDGINVAERIMSFANPHQIAVSRNYFECVSRISDEYAKLFHYEGSKTDKHVREHEVYLVSDSEVAITRVKQSAIERSMSTTQPIRDAMVNTQKLAKQDFKHKSNALGIFFAGLLLLAIGGGGYHFYTKKSLAAGKLETDAKLAQIADSKAAINPGPQTPKSAVNTTPKAYSSESTPAVKDGKVDVKAQKDSTSSQTTAQTSPSFTPINIVPTPPKTVAKVRIVANPWGQVTIDGKNYGTTPPAIETELSPGKHKVKIANSGAPQPFETEIEVKAGESVVVRHTFKN